MCVVSWIVAYLFWEKLEFLRSIERKFKTKGWIVFVGICNVDLLKNYQFFRPFFAIFGQFFIYRKR